MRIAFFIGAVARVQVCEGMRCRSVSHELSRRIQYLQSRGAEQIRVLGILLAAESGDGLKDLASPAEITLAMYMNLRSEVSRFALQGLGSVSEASSL